jgi:phage N-6-adenine-methyltransferase
VSHAKQNVTVFKPQELKYQQAVSEARIELAARLGNVEALEVEIDRMIDRQEDAVNWWRANVRRPGNRRSNISDTEIFQEQAEKILGFDGVAISRWAKKLSDRAHYREEVSRAAQKKLGLEAGENEWWTPALYIEAARKVLGAIDLDPATTLKANETVQAAQIFTRKDNGLEQRWDGRVWLNPPYAQPLIGQFISKLCGEYAERHCTAAVLLTHNYTDTEWFHKAEKSAELLCFTRGRIAFLNPVGEPAAPTQGQCFFYFGDDRKAFREEFSRFGFIR